MSKPTRADIEYAIELLDAPSSTGEPPEDEVLRILSRDMDMDTAYAGKVLRAAIDEISR